MGPQFHQTIYGKRILEDRFPQLVQNTFAVDDMNKKEETEKIYFCYHENFVTLSQETGIYSDMLVTMDLKSVITWLNECVTDAEEHEFLFWDTNDVLKLYRCCTEGKDFKAALYKKDDNNHEGYFKICVSCY